MQAAAEICAERGVPVEVTAFDLTYGELDLKVQVDAQAGAKPDVVLQGLNQVIPLDTNEFVVDLGPLMDGDEVVNEETMPALVAAGVDPADLTSWGAIEDAAATIAASGDEIYGIAFPQQEGWLPLQYLLTAGTQLVDETNTAVFNNDEGDLAVEHFHRLYSSGSAYPGDETASREAFAAGEVGMFVGSSAFIQQFSETAFEWTTVAFPPMTEGGEVRTAAGGAGISIFADAERQAAAWEVLRCALEADVLATFAVETIGYLPVRNDIADALAPGLLDAAPYAAPWSQFGLAGPWLNFPGLDGPRALETFNEAWVEAVQSSDEPTAVMDEAAAAVDALLG
jgi:ABC-type glycerol-3-phosphate transport system substrate-binding protein